ncbi:MAG: hypothetical protein CVU56_16835 [Deltaproteobacteria bacterium HGW-Deltaproteobacteria-14]|jgi:hypothetical protein|nr:MAG: hypothetical protein CVU56_16835 [Deltaproteobacteria bacterium HGW-Deltaproteobacteria-14]
MKPRPLLLLLLAASGGSSACLEASRPAAQDTAAADTADVSDAVIADVADTAAPDTVTTCSGTADCAPLAGPCRSAECVDRACVVTPTADGTPCGDSSTGTCQGLTWQPPDVCAAGACMPSEDAVCAALPGTCEQARCIPGVGCGTIDAPPDTPCVSDGGSQRCDGLVWHRPDVCGSLGECLEKGTETCVAGFCQEALCSPTAGCGVKPVGVAERVAGAWRFVLLRYADQGNGEVYGARGTLELGDDGRWSRGNVETSAAGAFPIASQGDFCVTEDGRIALTLGTEGGAPNTLYGRLTPQRDLLFLVSHDRAELVVAARESGSATPTTAGPARFHMVGVVKKATSPDIYAIDGVLSFDASGCLDRPATYQRSDQTAVVTIPAEGACLEVAANGAVSFPHVETSAVGITVPVSLSGWTLPNRDVIVTAIDTVTDVFPSLVIFVRESGAIGPSALDGGYDFGGLEATAAGYDRVEGDITYDGTGKVTSYHVVRPSGAATGGGGPQDRYTVAAAAVPDDGNLAGAYTHDVAVGATRDRRLGHVGPRVNTAGDPGASGAAVLVHVPVTSTWHLTPGIQIGVKHQ